MGIIAKIRAFIAKEIVLIVSMIAAFASCFIVPFDDQYAAYIDWHTLALLFSLMTVVTGLRFLGVLRFLGEWVVAHTRTKAMIALSLVFLTFVVSMVVTNDVALITFVPLAIIIMHQAKMDVLMGPIVALMTIGANLGSMLLPMGNPQNLYLYQMSELDFASFVFLMAPYTVFSAVLLVGSLFLLFRGQSNGIEKNRSLQVVRFAPSRAELFKILLYCALFILCLASVLGAVDAFLICFVVFAIVIIMDTKTIVRVDYGLLCTFIALFVFVGNMGRIPLIHDAIAQLVGSAPVLASVVLSQVISNVPAALLLSGFTDQWQALIVGTNLGGLGTLIASMASIISFKLITVEGLVSRGSYLRIFLLYNIGFLVVLLALNSALSLVF